VIRILIQEEKNLCLNSKQTPTREGDKEGFWKKKKLSSLCSLLRWWQGKLQWTSEPERDKHPDGEDNGAGESEAQRKRGERRGNSSGENDT